MMISISDLLLVDTSLWSDLAIVGGSLNDDIDTMSDTTKTIELQNTRMTNEFVTFILLYIFVRQLFHSSFSQRLLFLFLVCGSLNDDTYILWIPRKISSYRIHE